MTVKVKGFVEEFVPVYKRMLAVGDVLLDIGGALEIDRKLRRAASGALNDEYKRLKERAVALIEKYFGDEET